MNSLYENKELDDFCPISGSLKLLSPLARKELAHSFNKSKVTTKNGITSRISCWAYYDKHCLIAKGLYISTASEAPFFTYIEVYKLNDSDEIYDITLLKQDNLIRSIKTNCRNVFIKFLNTDYFYIIPILEERKKFTVYGFPGKKRYTLENIPGLEYDPESIVLLQNKHLVVMRSNLTESLIQIINIQTGNPIKLIRLNHGHYTFISPFSSEKNTIIIGFEEKDKTVFEIYHLYSGKTVQKRFCYLDLTDSNFLLQNLIVSKDTAQVAILLEECRSDLHKILFFDTQNFINQRHPKPIAWITQTKKEYNYDFRSAFGFFANRYFEEKQITKEDVSSIEDKEHLQKNSKFKF